MKSTFMFLLLISSIMFAQTVEIVSDTDIASKRIDASNFASAKVSTCMELLELGTGSSVSFEYRSNGKDTFITISYGSYVLERALPCPPFCAGEVFAVDEAEKKFGPVVGKSVPMSVEEFKDYLKKCNETMRFRIVD